MDKYCYTFKNMLDVIDAGYMNASSHKECLRKLKQIGIKPTHIHFDESWIGFEFMFINQTKFRYVNTHNGSIGIFKKLDLFFYVIVGSIILLILNAFILPEPIHYLLPGFFFLFLIPYSFCYQLNIDNSSKIITKQKKLIKLNCWKKNIDISNAKALHLTPKIAYTGGLERLYVIQIELADRMIAISSSNNEALEHKLARTISETLAIPLRFD